MPLEETFRLPREKKLPETKPDTRWEKFAKDKGITNKKRERMIFDENFQEWRPRFGYKRANNGIDELPIVEVGHGQDPFADPWAASRQSKKERVSKNLKNQLKNDFVAAGGKRKYKGGAGDVAGAMMGNVMNPGIPVDVDDKKVKRGRDGVRQALQLVQHSTQSMGRFDEMRAGEPVRKLKGKKRTFKDNSSSLTSEKDTMKAQLRIVKDKVDKKARGVTNSLAPYEGIIPDAPSDRFRQKKGKVRSNEAKGGGGSGSTTGSKGTKGLRGKKSSKK